MLLGPVFNAELLTTARRARYYVVRFIYGSIILFQIYATYQSNEYRINATGGRLSINDMSMFAYQLFVSFAILQAVVVLLLTPALVGGTIADERQRKTLHYLLTSQLSSAEIILGKLAARLLQVVVLVALGLPVVSLMGLFGIDLNLMLLAYAGTFTTMFFLGSASILVSVISRRPREAISVLYVFELVWLVALPMLMFWMPYWDPPWPEIANVIKPVLEYVTLTSPTNLIGNGPRMGVNTMISEAFWSMGLQIAWGTLFVVLAAFRLRPSARTEGSTSSVNRWFKKLMAKRKWLPRKPCGDDGMLWKEMHVSRTGGLTKAVMVLLGISLVVLILYSGFEPFIVAFDEMMRDGYFEPRGQARGEFNTGLRVFSTGIYILWFLGVAAAAATGISSEREEDQWLALTSTQLSGHEILRAKMIGPVWGLRFLAYLMFALWGFGLIVGAVHPMAILASLLCLVVFTWFLTALGTFFSLRAKNSTRALASTIALLIFLNGGYLFCCIPFQPNGSLIFSGMTPFAFTIALFSSEDLFRLAQPRNVYDRTGEAIAASVLCVLFYGFAAAGITAALFSMFDAVVDRPDRLRQNLTANQQKEFLKGRGKDIVYQDV